MAERLRIERANLSFGALVVAADISLALEDGARTALIGPNGAGKTTLVNLISGALTPSSGDIRLDGVSITGLSQAARTRRGIVRTFQISRLFPDLTVADNLRVAVIQRRREGFRLWPIRAPDEDIDREVAQQLDALGLAPVSGRQVRNLALGEQRLVEIALALALRPRVLLLDEPSAGVPQSESKLILDAIDALPADLAILLIEHDMDLVFRFARRIAVMVSGTMLMEATPAEVASDKRVEQIYFGRGDHGRGRQ